MALVKYTGDDVRRAYGVEMKQGDTHEFTDAQAAHLTRLAEFVVVGVESVGVEMTTEGIGEGIGDASVMSYPPNAKPLPKAKPIGTRKGKKK